MFLFGYEPPIPRAPIELGAVFAHAQPWAGPASTAEYPTAWRERRQVFRAYERRGWIHDATRVFDGQDPEALIAVMPADPDVDQIHSRNVAWGCYMFAITRAT